MARYIDADKLIDDMINTFRDDEDGIAINEYWSHQVVLDVIDKEETADVKPVVRGEWINNMCSNCGCPVTYKFDADKKEWIKGSYCHNCGARMGVE